MPTKIALIIDNPTDVERLEDAIAGLLSAAEKIPTVKRVDSGKVWPKEDGTPTPAHRTIDLTFDGYDEASAAVASPEGGEFFAALEAAGATFTGLFVNVER